MNTDTITPEFDEARNDTHLLHMTVEEAIDAFLAQTGFSRVEDKEDHSLGPRVMLHEMAHVLADAVGQRKDKGITLAGETIALVTELILLGQSAIDPIKLESDKYMTEDEKCPTPEKPFSVGEIRLIAQEFYSQAQLEIVEEIRSLKTKVFLATTDLSKIKNIPTALAELIERPWRSNLWDDSWLNLLPLDQRAAVDNAFAEKSAEFSEFERGLNEREMSEEEFLQAVNRATAMKAYFANGTGREITDIPYKKLMQTPVTEFGIMPTQDGKKIRFFPFIPIGDGVGFDCQIHYQQPALEPA